MQMLRRKLPPVNSLVVFEAAGRHLNFTRAAEELALTQSAVSRQVQLLEEHLGAPLFQRQGRSLHLTRDGIRLHRAVTMGLGHVADVAVDIRRHRGPGELTVATSVSFASYWLVARLATVLHRPLPATVLWDHPTLERLERFLTGQATGGARAPMLPMDAGDGIAIVGLACRLPGADDPEAFWRLLIEGVDAIREVPADRWPMGRLFDPDPQRPGRMSTRWGGFLDAVDLFDADFFKTSPREAAQMDPQQRLALELAWEAFEDAAIRPSRLRSSRCSRASPGSIVLRSWAGTGSAGSRTASAPTAPIKCQRARKDRDTAGRLVRAGPFRQRRGACGRSSVSTRVRLRSPVTVVMVFVLRSIDNASGRRPG